MSTWKNNRNTFEFFDGQNDFQQKDEISQSYSNITSNIDESINLEFDSSNSLNRIRVYKYFC
jgi:hypothetical protein